ncbi:MAG: hypothetical protein KJ697_04830 [Nanoarchaeota archaeon]|nr:hypothetical protein [Nanoarchaeota archaeon]MBU4072460.1 hypothetical protein [Candidatus Thermoplasmatota archaeon]
MSKLTIPIEKHLAYPVFAQTAYNNRHFGETREFASAFVTVFSATYEPNNLLLPNGGKNYTSELKTLGVLKKSWKGYEVTDKGRKVLEKVIHWGDLSSWTKTKDILTETPNPTNIDVLTYLNDNGSTRFDKLKKNLSEIYSKNKIVVKIPFYKMFDSKPKDNIVEAVEYGFHRWYVSGDGKSLEDFPDKYKMIPKIEGENSENYHNRMARTILALDDKKELDITNYGVRKLKLLQEISDMVLEY